MFIRTRSSIALGAAVLSIPALSLAPQTGYTQQIEEIIVSVRRRDENLQEVPLSVSTIGEQEIARLGINNTADVVKYSAGLEFDEGFGAQDTRIVIRGLSPTRGRSNVAILVDGIDFTGEAISTAGGGLLVNQQLLDVQRVEVVKGPQSALYGRSAFAGALQYITKRPSLEETEGTANVQFGNGNGADGVRFDGAFGGPVSDSFGLRVNGLIHDQDGYYQNVLTGSDVGGSKGYGVALAGLYDGGGIFASTGRVAYSHDEYEPQAQARYLANTVIDVDNSVAVQNGDTDSLIYTSGLGRLLSFSYPGCVAPPETADGAIGSCLGTPNTIVAGSMPDGDELTVIQSENPRTGTGYPGTDVDLTTATLNLEWTFGGGILSSLTGLSRLESTQFFDAQNDAMPAGDFTSLDNSYSFTIADCGWQDCARTAQEIDFDNTTDLLSTEIRWQSTLDGPLNYTVGALYWEENAEQLENSNTIAPAIFRQGVVFFPIGGPPPPGPLPIETTPVANDNLANVYSAGPAIIRRDTQSISLYGVLEWDISATWKLSIEGRWVDETLDVTGPICDVPATLALTGLATSVVGGMDFCNTNSFRGSSSVAVSNAAGSLPAGTYTKAVFGTTSAKFDESFFVPKAVVEWTPSDRQLWYFSVAEGIKPGGISTITAGAFYDPDANQFDKETLWAYELGSKSTLLDGALLLNAAIYYQDYTDKQVGVSRFDPVIQSDVGSIENAGSAEIYGLELEATWAITDRWTLAAAYAYTNSEYTQFEFETGSLNNVARSLAAGGGGCLDIIPSEGTGVPDDTTELCTVSLNGNDVEDVPRHSFVGNLGYEAPINDQMSWYGGASYIYRDNRYVDEFNVKELDSYWLLDLRAGLVKDKMELIIFVDNVFDDDTVKSAVDFGSIIDSNRQGFFPPSPPDGVILSMPDPRVVGVRANFSF